MTAGFDFQRVLNPDPGVHSSLNLSGYLTPVGTSLALPTIQESDRTTNEEKKENLPPAAAPVEGTYYLVS